MCFNCCSPASAIRYITCRSQLPKSRSEGQCDSVDENKACDTKVVRGMWPRSRHTSCRDLLHVKATPPGPLFQITRLSAGAEVNPTVFSCLVRVVGMTETLPPQLSKYADLFGRDTSTQTSADTHSKVTSPGATTPATTTRHSTLQEALEKASSTTPLNQHLHLSFADPAPLTFASGMAAQAGYS